MKRKIIIQEIISWKKNKMLPEHYCDFLLSMYQEGINENNQSSDHMNDNLKMNNQLHSKKSLSSFSLKKILLLLICLVVIVSFLLVFYFIDFSKQMQISLTIFSFILTYLIAFALYKQRKPHAHLMFSFSCLILLGVLAQSISFFDIANPYHRSGFLIIGCLIWFVTGITFRIFYLQFIALFSITLISGWVTLPLLHQNFNWFILEMVWLSIAAFSYFLFFLLKAFHPKLGLNLLTHSFIFSLVPEVQILYMKSADLDIVQVVLFTKMIVLVFIFYFIRNVIIELLKPGVK